MKIINLAIVSCFIIVGILGAIHFVPEVQAIDDFEVDFECINEDDVTIEATSVKIYDTSRTYLESFDSDANGVITVDTGDISGFQDGDELIFIFEDDAGDCFKEEKRWEVHSSWADFTSASTICMAYQNYQVSSTNPTNNYKTVEHHWSGKHNENFISYTDISRMVPMQDTVFYYPKFALGESPRIRVVTNAAGHFNNEYMQDGVWYQWKIYWKITIDDPQGNYVDDVDHGPITFDRDNTDGDAESILYDPDISILLWPLKAPVSGQNQYELTMEMDCDMRKNIDGQGWSVWTDIPIADVTHYFDIRNET